MLGQIGPDCAYRLYRASHMNDPIDAAALRAGAELPDPLLTLAGHRIVRASQWPQRRREIMDLMLPLAYGRIAPAPAATRLIQLHAAVVQRLAGARLLSCRVEPLGMAPFMLRLYLPAGDGPFPVIISGDGCWQNASDAILGAMLGRGFAFAQFNRVEIAPDPGGANNGLAIAQPAPQVRTLAAWAWAFHRVVDALSTLDWIDRQAIAVVGHSRGGKAALLAGATDERIALTSANNSGAGGAGCFRQLGPGAETLGDLMQAYAYWFDPQLQCYVGREHELPFDQHFLKALIAPRALLTTEALDDLWANPQGSWQTHRAARCVFELMGAVQQQAIVFRPGGHAHNAADWTALLDFADTVLRGQPSRKSGESPPFAGLPPPARWMRAERN